MFHPIYLFREFIEAKIDYPDVIFWKTADRAAVCILDLAGEGIGSEMACFDRNSTGSNDPEDGIYLLKIHIQVGKAFPHGQWGGNIEITNTLSVGCPGKKHKGKIFCVRMQTCYQAFVMDTDAFQFHLQI